MDANERIYSTFYFVLSFSFYSRYNNITFGYKLYRTKGFKALDGFFLQGGNFRV